MLILLKNLHKNKFKINNKNFLDLKILQKVLIDKFNIVPTSPPPPHKYLAKAVLLNR